MSEIVTRFAPSPTGFLHIGGARTALFNWLYARRTNGKFLLRIEDTDRERSTPGGGRRDSRRARWLGLTGTARRCQFTAPSAIARWRCSCSRPATPTAATASRRSSSRCARSSGSRACRRATTDAGATAIPPRRLRASARHPAARAAGRRDHRRRQGAGQGRVPNKDLDDLVLLRSDGNPTYMLAVVVDDHDMGVTHVIRGDDHLTNAARQTQIYQALGWDVPVLAHIPLIHGPDGAKLSKRHGALGVDAYRAMGYLPEALRNYLVRLGWSHGDKEFFSADEMIAAFDLGGRPLAVALRLRQAREHERPFHARDADEATLYKLFLDTLPYLPGGPEMPPSSTRASARSFARRSTASRIAPRPWWSWSTGRSSCSRSGRWRWTPRPRTFWPRADGCT